MRGSLAIAVYGRQTPDLVEKGAATLQLDLERCVILQEIIYLVQIFRPFFYRSFLAAGTKNYDLDL